jgi:nitrogen-specific signal transduction histidine kinase/CheY-like chemotaxis protein
MKRNTEAYENEMAYLKQINESAESLRIKEIELEHSRKLRTIGALTSGISHDFNNLLTPILGHSEFLLATMNNALPYYDSIHDIYLSSLKAKELIEHILVFSHLDADHHEVSPLALSKVVLDAVKFIKPIVSSDIKMMTRIEKSSRYIMANETEISQIILNLFTNAIYAMKESGGQLRVTLFEVIEEDKTYADLVVEDTGCGMDEETMKKMYDPFFTSKPAGEGTGLGLLLVQSIVEKYKGKIDVSSILGEGTQFTIRFLLTDEIKEEVVKKVEVTLSGTENILIIDDNEAIVKVLTQGLEVQGYKVRGFTNSQDGFDYFMAHSEAYPIIILDESMPNITGSEFARCVKEINKKIRIILITAHKKKAVVIAEKNKDIDVCMMKPLTAKDISKEVRRLMEETKDV